MKTLFFIGFMGVGKTSVSAALGRMLKLPVIEMDQQIARNEGMTIPEIFAQKDEGHFRQCETALLEGLAAGSTCLVSCGGGVAMRQENVAAMRRCGTVVLLTARPEVILDRVKDSDERSTKPNTSYKIMSLEEEPTMSQKYPITISAWTLGDQCPFEERVSAAKEAGFEGIGLRAETYVDALNEGLFDADILAILDKYGMKVTEVEYIVQWAENHRSYEQKYKEQMCFHMCQLFGVNHINCGLMENYSVEHTAQKLRELCHRAGKYTIGVEPMPYSGLPDIKKAWAVVKASGCDNAKLILDSWHWVRAGQPYDQALLADIPAEKIVAVQINDVQAHPYAKSILRDESMHDRMLPGTGYGDTAGFVKMLRDKGIQPAVMGVEVISDEILAAGVAAAAKANFDATRAVLAQAWPEVLEK